MDEDTLREMYKDMLDESYPIYRIGTMEFYASDILEACDPIAFRVGLSDYESFMMEEEND